MSKLAIIQFGLLDYTKGQFKSSVYRTVPPTREDGTQNRHKILSRDVKLGTPDERPLPDAILIARHRIKNTINVSFSFGPEEHRLEESFGGLDQVLK